jgi:hypothetical protein
MATLNDNALTLLATVKSELGISTSSDDDYLTRQINRYSQLFEEATDKLWYRADDYVESVKSVGDTRITVQDRRPLLAINSIAVKGETVDSDDYEIEDADRGWIRIDDDFWESTGVATMRMERHTKYHELRVDVDYNGGYVTPKQEDDGTFSPRTLPASIEGAVIDTVAQKYRRKGSQTNVTSESIGSASVSYGSPKGGSMSGQVLGSYVTESFEGAVQRHRNRSVL